MNENQKSLVKLTLGFLSLLGASWGAQHLSRDTFSFIIIAGGVSTALIYAIANIKIIITFLKNWPKSIIYGSFIIYICKILAEKIINASMDIEVENIRYSSSICGLLLSIPISLLVISTFLLIISPIKKILTPEKYRSENQKNERFPNLKFLFAACILMASASITSAITPLIPYTLLADATKVSSCGPVEDYIVYLRKSHSACYQIRANLAKGIYDRVEIASKP